jgi:hypothetical protein
MRYTMLHSGHGTVRAISSTHTVAKIVSTCKIPNSRKSVMFKIIREQKKTVFAYYYALGQHTLRRNHLAAAKELFKRGCTMNPDHPYLPAWEKAISSAAGK